MPQKLKFLIIAVLLLGALGFEPAAAQQSVIHVGVILDGPSERNAAMQREFEKQIAEFLGGEFDARFTPENTMVGDWTVAGVKAAVERLLQDKDIEFILALGPISANEMALRKNLPKPAIAGIVIDAELQSFPKKDGASGVKNLNYLDEAYSVTRTIKAFQEVVPFKKLAVLHTPAMLEAMPRFHERALQEVQTLGAQLEFVPVTTAAAAALQALPSDVDAVYFAPLLQLSHAEFNLLVAGVNQRRLPSFSYLGRAEVESGVMASYAPTNDITRRARRIASNMQRILRGEEAGTLAVDFSSAPQLVINMATARAIGFYPNWKTLTEAELLHPEEEQGRKLSLAASVREAVQANLDLLAANKQVESGAQNVNKARASLLPQVGAAATGTLVRKETAEASFGSQPERQLEGALSFSQSIYNEEARSSFSIQKHLQRSRENERESLRLDIALQAASTYLNVLRAKALARIQRSNLRLTLSNLELARLRENVGASGRSDVYRWESQAATSRKNVLDADAQANVVKIEMNRVLNRSLEEPFTTEETVIDDPSLITGEARLFNYFANPQTFAVFRDFMVAEGLNAAPELQQLDAVIVAQKRAHTAATRSFWLPNVALEAGLQNIFHRDGAGSTGALQLPPSIPFSLPAPQDLNWSMKVKMSLPLFAGFARTAAREQTSIDVERFTVERQSAQLTISQRIRASLHVAGASYAGIEQARAAAEAARKNLELVTDAYRSGAVSIITLIDAQNAALVADETATNALYNFLLDLMQVERAIGQFDFFRTAEERQGYFKRLEEFYRKAGVRL